jgi:hypothetical protein
MTTTRPNRREVQRLGAESSDAEPVPQPYQPRVENTPHGYPLYRLRRVLRPASQQLLATSSVCPTRRSARRLCE